MDVTVQLFPEDIDGWKRGLYDDIEHTFRAPVVNWIFRTAMANTPHVLRYVWGQVKPVFETVQFAEVADEYRRRLYAVEAQRSIPTYRMADLDLRPPEYRELRGQLETFDIVAPRLAVLFELLERGATDTAIGDQSARDRAATTPFPDWFDRDRGHRPTMQDAKSIDDAVTPVLEDTMAYHGISEAIPSIYRCLAQWPSFFEQAWTDMQPVLTSSAYTEARSDAESAADAFVDSTPYNPRITHACLRDAGFDASTVDDWTELCEIFTTVPENRVLPTLPLWAVTASADSQRWL